MKNAGTWISPDHRIFWPCFGDLREESELQKLSNEELSRRAYRLLRRFVKRIGHWFQITDDATIDEICREVWLRMEGGLADRWNPAKGTAPNYLNGVIKVIVMEHARLRAARRTERLDHEWAEFVDTRSPDPVEAAILAERTDLLLKWFKKQTKRQQLALRRRFGPLFGVAAEGGTVPNDYVIKHRLMPRLREWFSAFGMEA